MGERLATCAVALGLLVPAAASAHGVGVEHESPSWCGSRLAFVADAGLTVLDGARVVAALPLPSAFQATTKNWYPAAFHAWSPACDRIAVVGQRAVVVDVARRTMTDLGPMPGGFATALRLRGPLRAIRFSPSGERFVVAVVNQTIGDAAVARFDIPSASSSLLAFPHGQVHALAMLDEDTAVAAVTPGGGFPGVRLFRATTSAVVALNTTDYGDARFSAAPVVLGVLTARDEFAVVDAQTGAERLVASGVTHLAGLSADGSHAVIHSGSGSPTRPAVLNIATGQSTGLDPSVGSSVFWPEHSAFTVDGTATLAEGDAGHVVYDDGSGPLRVLFGRTPASSSATTSAASDFAIAPDGRTAAFLLEEDEGAPPSPRPECDIQSLVRTDLYVVTLPPTAAPRRLLTVSRDHSCGIAF